MAARRPTSRAVSAAVLAALLGGCANLAPRFERPVAPLRDAWPERAEAPARAASATGSDVAAPDLAWRDFITDTRLRQVIAASLANNRDLRVAALNIEQSRALYRIQRAAAWPQFDAAAVATRQRSPASTSGGGANGGDANGSARSQYTVQLGLASYEIDFFNRVGNLAESALANFFAVEQNRQTVQISLVAEVATAWLTLAADLDSLQLARDTLASQQASFDLTQRTRDLGGTSGLAVARARTTVDAARVEVARYVTLVAQDRNALELLVGRPLDEAWWPARPVATGSPAARPAGASRPPPAASAPAYDPPPSSLLLDVPAGLPSEALLRRPDVRAAEQLLRAANADIGAARAALYPSISLTAAAGTQSDSLSGLFKSGSGLWSIAPRIDLPLFDGGERRANVQFSEAQQAIEIAQYERTLQTAFREVADVLALRATLAEQLAAQQSLIDANQRSLALSDALFRNGASSYLDVLDAQRSLYAAQQSLITLRLSEQANRIGLYRSLGGGWGPDQATSN